MMSHLVKQVAEGSCVEMLDGIHRKTLAYGEKTLLCQFKLEKGKHLPLHSHLYEQTGVLIAGNMVMTIDGVPYNFKPGDSWSIYSNVLHEAHVIEESLIYEVFSPVREDYID